MLSPLRAPVLIALLTVAAGQAAAEPVPTWRSVELARTPPEEAPERGPRTAVVTVELFCNFAHVQCAAAERLLRRLAERHPDGLRVLYRQVVLPFRDSQMVATAAMEAFRQGRFLELADASATRGAPLRARDLEAVAVQAGIDLEALRAAIAGDRHAGLLERDALRREMLGVGTIGLVWNGEPGSNELTVDNLERSYRRAHARAALRLADGVPRDELYAVLASEAGPARRARLRPDGSVPRSRVVVGEAPARGDPDAAVTIVVFTDFECTFCRRQEEVLRRMLALYPRDVLVAFKHFPLSRGGPGRATADAAECARRQGKFWDFHDLLLEGPQRRRTRDLEHIAFAAGVDLERMRADLPTCQARVDADVAEGKALGVESTPTLFVNGLKLVGMRGLAELRLHLEDELAPGVLGNFTGGGRRVTPWRDGAQVLGGD